MELFVMSARTGHTHFSEENLDWHSHNTICGKKNLSGFISIATYPESKYKNARRGVSCARCMVKAGFYKKSQDLGVANSGTELHKQIGWTQTGYVVLKPFVRMEKGRKLVEYKVGDEIKGNSYDRSR